MRLYTTDLVKKYKARTVVNHVSIDVQQGEIVGLLGPNGAGKTTSFYMIVGLIKPNEGRIFIVQNEKEVPIKQIIDKVHRTEFLRGSKLDARGWTLDVLNCVNMIEETTFTLEQMYRFEEMLAIKHPDNHHVKDKIRQQLQMLRDNGIIEFIGRGHYRKI